MMIDRRYSRWNLVLLALVVGLSVSLVGGCATPTTYHVDETSVVSESRAKRDLGVDYLSTRRTGMAIRELTESLELDPSDPETHLWLGEAYRRKGRSDRAENYLLEALALAEGRRDLGTQQAARLNLSALLSQQGRYEDAIEHCEQLATDPTFAAPWRPLSNCGWALMKLGRLEEARGRFESALEFFPRFASALLNLGILEEQQGHHLAAIQAFEKALKSRRLGLSGHAEANFRLGEIFVSLGDRDQAVSHFRSAAKVAPEADWGSQSQAYLDLLQ